MYLDLTTVPSTATEAEFISNVAAQLQSAISTYHILVNNLIVGDVTWENHNNFKVVAERFSNVTSALNFQVYSSTGSVYTGLVGSTGGVSCRLHTGTVVS